MAFFPRVRDGVNFHLNPAECILFSAPHKGDVVRREEGVNESRSAVDRITIFGLAPMEVINLDAFEVLSLCDGTRSQTDILRQLGLSTRRTGSEESSRASAVLGFLERASERRHIDILSGPEEYSKKPVVTGGTDLFIPFHISLEITRRCNLSCSYCYAAADPRADENELSGSHIIDMLSEWLKHGLRGIEITGGEPLLHSDFWPILNYCLEEFPLVALLSNGTLADDNTVSRFAEHRDKLLISVSLDASDPDTHDRISGMPGAFERAVSTAGILIKKGLKVRIAMTVTPDNWREIEPTLLLAKEIGASWFGWSPAMPFGRGCTVEWDLTSDELEELSGKELELLESHKGFVPAIPKVANHMPSSWNCGIGWKNVVVGPSGLVRPCLLLSEESFAVADLNKEGIREAFDKDIIFRLRELPLPSDELCGDCRLRTYCTTCPVRAMNRERVSGPECSWAKTTGADALAASMGVLAGTYVGPRH